MTPVKVKDKLDAGLFMNTGLLTSPLNIVSSMNAELATQISECYSFHLKDGEVTLL